MSVILKQLKKYVNVVPTTKDLIYKDKTIDIHNIDKSYKGLVKNGKANELPFTYGNHSLYFLTERKYVSEIEKLMDIHAYLTNMEQDTHIKTLSPQNMMNNEIFNSLWIEGVRSSKKTIKQFLKKKDIDVGNALARYSHNYRDALNFIASTNKINEVNLLGLFINLSRDIDLGENKLDGIPYRLDMVQIGDDGKTGIAPQFIKESFDSVFAEIEKQEKNESEISKIQDYAITAIILHYLFELIHPYYDMNGRMGRLFTLWYAQKFGIGNYFVSLSESINLYKKELYYSAFKDSDINGYKYDVTYFVQSIFFALAAQKMGMYVLDYIDRDLKNKYKQKLGDLQRDIIIGITAKDEGWYQIEDFILGTAQINQGQLSTALSQLVEWKILDSTNTKPKQYKFVWKKDFAKFIDKNIEIILTKGGAKKL